MNKTLAVLAASLLLLAGCLNRDTTDSAEVLEKAFGVREAPGVEVVHAYYHSKSEAVIVHTDGWMLQLKGPGAEALVRSRFPDLQPYSGPALVFMPSDAKLAWWNATGDRDRFESPSDARYTIYRQRITGDYFLSYMAGY